MKNKNILTKKNMFSYVTFFSVLILTSNLISCTNKNENVNSFYAMNTYMTVKSFGSSSAEANLKAQQEILKLENLFSTTLPDSDIYKINNSDEDNHQLDSNTSEVLSLALSMAHKTEGALNPCLYPVTRAWGFTTGEYTVPREDLIQELLLNCDYTKVYVESNTAFVPHNMMLDLGAVAKGYAGDKAIEILKSNGIKSAILDLGGNVQCLGSKTDGSDWKVGIKNPFTSSIAAVVNVSDKAIITSGGYERFFTADDGKNYIHIFDPKTGRPVEGHIASATIIAQSGAYADCLSTATFVMGKSKALKLWRSSKDFEMILIMDDSTLCYTKGLEGILELTDSDLKTIVME